MFNDDDDDDDDDDDGERKCVRVCVPGMYVSVSESVRKN